LMYAATGNKEFKKHADYIVKEFKEVQDKRGDGYLGAIINRDGIDAHELFIRLSQGEIKSSGFDLNGLWSPWYTLHKTYGGLRDAFRYTGNRMALELEIKFAEWAERILAPLNAGQIQRMLNTEFGGMNEIMVDLYADTGDKRWLDLSYRFEHRSFIEPLKRHQDILEGKHGNTQVQGRPGRRGGSWFSFDMPVESESPMALVVTYYSGERSVSSSFDILVDGQAITHQEVTRSYPQRLFDVEYAIDPSLIKDKEKVNVRFEAAEGSSVSAIFGIRMIRKDKDS